METRFYIVVSLKTPGGFENIARFYLGNNREKAFAVFHRMKGHKNISDSHLLFIEFRETRKGLPVHLDVKTCTLNQLAENCKLVTKEVFKSENLEIN